MAEVKGHVGELSNAVTEHRIRLENGTKVFAKWDDRIGEIEKRTSPPSAIKTASITFGIFLTAAGALWGLSNMLRDRPTTDQLERVMEKASADHEETGHKDIKADIKEIHTELGEQKALINGATGKLDVLLNRVPEGKQRRGQ